MKMYFRAPSFVTFILFSLLGFSGEEGRKEILELQSQVVNLEESSDGDGEDYVIEFFDEGFVKVDEVLRQRSSSWPHIVREYQLAETLKKDDTFPIGNLVAYCAQLAREQLESEGKEEER